MHLCQLGEMSDDTKLYAPSVARNRDPILNVLRANLPASGLILEVASGTGEHIAHFATALPGLRWQPTELDAERRVSIDAWTAGLSNVMPAISLDAMETQWPVRQADVVLCINMIHITPWAAAEGLVAGAARLLPIGGLLILYGPYRRAGIPMEPSNSAFDADLRSRNPDWGLREVEAVVPLATAAGFDTPVIRQMPSNNLMLMFPRRP
jgi:hypothetical protein